MNKNVTYFVAGTLALAMLFAISPALFAGQDVTGNGAPSGTHYNLNIIGVKDKSADMDGSNGHVIFVPLDGKTKINLEMADDFAVVDANGTDADGALFQLPDPGLDPYVVGEQDQNTDTVSDYSVFVRSLGKPGGWATITTCAELVDSTFAGLLGGRELKEIKNRADGDAFCSIEQVGQEITTRTKGKSTFTNVTAELLTIVFQITVDTDGDGVADSTLNVRVPIFDDIIQGEYWEYDNNGLKLLQVRFYPVGTDVSAGDADLPTL